jgi:ankyrin repeat protein
MLHHLALAGSTTGVKVLLDAGADPNQRTADGRTAAQLADTLAWDDVVALLAKRRRG